MNGCLKTGDADGKLEVSLTHLPRFVGFYLRSLPLLHLHRPGPNHLGSQHVETSQY